MTSVLNAKHFHDEAAAYEFLEARIWPNGPVCPHCGGVDRISKMGGESTRVGVYKCYQCRKQLRVTVGTVFEASHVKLHIWLQAVALLTSSKKGMSSNQLHRILGVTLKTAWFMSHRIREAMRDGKLGPLGGEGKIVEADETYYGRAKEKHLLSKRATPYTKGGWKDKGAARAIVSLVERGGKPRGSGAPGGALTTRAAPCDAARPHLRDRAPSGAPLATSFRHRGRAFRETVARLSVSQLLAGGRSTAGRSPQASRARGCEPRPRAPHLPRT